MSTSYSANKKSIYNWRLNHPEKHLESHRVAQKNYYHRTKIWKAVSKVYRQILLEEYEKVN